VNEVERAAKARTGRDISSLQCPFHSKPHSALRSGVLHFWVTAEPQQPRLTQLKAGQTALPSASCLFQ
jgi:hypothetical protein